MKILGWFLIIIGVLIGGSTIAYGFWLDYNYNKNIGDYLDNAFLVNTPDKMKEQVLAARQGMVDAGLTEDMYGALIFKKPDNSMKFQYTHIDSIIERIDAVAIWYNNTYSGTAGQQTESLGDVYEQKMDSLRKFLAEGGRSDWIAQDTWYINKHVIFYIGRIIALIISLLLLFGGLFLILADDEI